MTPAVDLTLMDGARISRSLKRMAYEIVERNKADKPIVLFGINERGKATAESLADILDSLLNDKVISIPFPLEQEEENGQVLKELEAAEIANAFIIVVDDVIFSGRTMFKALKTITQGFDISEVHTAVLVDRGHRKFPVQAEFYGMELPTKLDEHVSVVVEDGNLRQVTLSNQ